MSDEQIDRSDIPELDKEFFHNAKLVENVLKIKRDRTTKLGNLSNEIYRKQ